MALNWRNAPYDNPFGIGVDYVPRRMAMPLGYPDAAPVDISDVFPAPAGSTFRWATYDPVLTTIPDGTPTQTLELHVYGPSGLEPSGILQKLFDYAQSNNYPLLAIAVYESELGGISVPKQVCLGGVFGLPDFGCIDLPFGGDTIGASLYTIDLLAYDPSVYSPARAQLAALAGVFTGWTGLLNLIVVLFGVFNILDTFFHTNSVDNAKKAVDGVLPGNQIAAAGQGLAWATLLPILGVGLVFAGIIYLAGKNPAGTRYPDFVPQIPQFAVQLPDSGISAGVVGGGGGGGGRRR